MTACAPGGCPGLAAGDLIATLALPPWLPYAADADAAGLILLAEPGAVRLAAAGARHRSVDPARSLSRSGREVLAQGPAAAGAVAPGARGGTLACAAQLLGAGRALLEASVRHARQRAQFGRPIGAFQAVKHQLADVAIGLEFARPLLDAAAVAAGHGWATAGQGRVGGQGRLHRRGPAGRPGRAAGARRDRLHPGARPAPVADQGARAGRRLGQPGRAPAAVWPRSTAAGGPPGADGRGAGS